MKSERARMTKPGREDLPAPDSAAALRLQARQARQAVVAGTLRGQPLLDQLLAVHYLHRDAWVDELLGLEEAPPDDAALPRGAVPYLPCGVDEIIALVQETPLDANAQLVDLGSGLGRVAMLAHLLCGARTTGIEIQAALVQLARARSQALALTDVSFTHANAAEAPLEGSVFFFYAPFNGALLTAVLRQLEAVARRHPITVCAVAIDFRGVPWLRPRAGDTPSVSLYDSRIAP